VDPSLSDLATGGGVFAAVVGLLVWAVKRVLDMTQEHLNKQASALEKIGDRTSASLERVATSLEGVTHELRDVATEVRALRDDVTPPARPVSLLHSKGREG
jgi:hypothetical protein